MKAMHNKGMGVKLIILTLSLVFICIGVLREEHFAVLNKAINICLECIGVG